MLEEELLHLYPQLAGAQRLDSLPGLRELDRALLLAAAGDVRRLRSARALGKLGGCAESQGTPGKAPRNARSPSAAATSCATLPFTPPDTSSKRALPSGRFTATAPKAHRQTSRDRVREPAAARDLAHGQQRRRLQPRKARPCPEPLAHTQPRLSSHDTPERKPASAISSPRARARNKGPCARQRPHKAPGHQGRTRT